MTSTRHYIFSSGDEMLWILHPKKVHGRDDDIVHSLYCVRDLNCLSLTLTPADGVLYLTKTRVAASTSIHWRSNARPATPTGERARLMPVEDKKSRNKNNEVRHTIFVFDLEHLKHISEDDTNVMGFALQCRSTTID